MACGLTGIGFILSNESHDSSLTGKESGPVGMDSASPAGMNSSLSGTESNLAGVDPSLAAMDLNPAGMNSGPAGIDTGTAMDHKSSAKLDPIWRQERLSINSSRPPPNVELLSFGVGSIINDVMKKVSNFDDRSWETFKPPNYDHNQEGFLINVALLLPESRGRLVFNTAEDASQPEIQLNPLSSPSDMARLVRGRSVGVGLTFSTIIFV